MRSAGRLLLAIGLGLTGCARDGAPPPPAQPLAPPPPAAGVLAAPPSIVLITLDTLRREHLGCYGYFRDTTPRIDAFAAEALLFERALATMASTLPSHLTMLTGLYPHQHGMNSNRRGASVPFTSELGRLSAAAVLAECGYRTAGFVSAAPLATSTGVQVGFETYVCRRKAAGDTQQRAAHTNELALAWLEEQADETGPFFLWVHYFDPHEPSDPPPAYARLFTTDERQREWIRARGIDPAALAARFAHSDRVRRHFLRNSPGKRREDARKEALRVTIDDVADLMNRYDGELRYLDEHVGELLAALRRHGHYEDAIIAMVADHGQSLGENEWLGHGSITNVNTYVPLILRLPAALALEPQRIDALVSLTDLMPTILARFELPGSELLRAQFEGEDVLSGAFQRDLALAERTADEIKDGETGRMTALHSGRWKFVHRPAGRDELFDLEGAGESADVSAQHPEVASRLRAETLALLARRPALLDDEPGAVDESLLESLEDLGYGGEGDDEEDGDDGEVGADGE